MPQGEGAYPSLERCTCVALDVETYDPGLHENGPGEHRSAFIAGIAIGTDSGFRRYYPVRHAMGENLDAQHVFAWLRRELKHPVPKIGANIIYDLAFLAKAGVHVAGPFYDVQNAEALLNENKLSYSLESLAQHYLGEGKKDDVMGKWLRSAFGSKIKDNIWRAPASVVGPYAEGDVDLPLRIFARQKELLERDGLWDVFMLEARLIPMLLAMRQRGVRVDITRAEQLADTLADRIADTLNKIKDLTGHDVDIWAAESLARMFSDRGVTYPLTEKEQRPSFRKDWLNTCKAPEAQLVAEARRYDKCRTTFVQGAIIDGAVDGVVHCQFHQLRSEGNGTVSGRLSSSNPNLQNLPIRDEELGPLIRNIFIPEHGQRWWKYDWSQIEFRLAVHFAAVLKLKGSREAVLAYRENPDTDYHVFVSKLTGLSRKLAKGINFGLVYGMGLETLCWHLGVSQEQGQSILKIYHDKVPFVKPLYNTASTRAAERGEIITLLGRHRRFNVWNKGNQYFRESEVLENVGCVTHGKDGWQRAFTHKALNGLLQGSAADIMKQGMVQIWESGVCDVLGAPHLTVHDELDGSTDQSQRAQEALAEVKRIMETCVTLRLPLRADGGVGDNWGAI